MESKQLGQNNVSLKGMYVWGVNSTVTKHSDYFVWQDTSECVARRCDDTVDKKRVDSCVLKRNPHVQAWLSWSERGSEGLFEKKTAKMEGKWPRFGGPRPSWQLGWAVNWVDWLCPSADKRMWSGRHAVVMVRWAAVGRDCSALICRSSWTGNWAAGHEGYPPPDCSGQGEGRSFLASNWASHAVAAAPSFQTCFACAHMYILYSCVYICVCVYVCGHVYIYTCACVYVYVYVCVTHTCMCMCMHICA